MPNMRKPAPRKTPTLLRELVRDLDERLEGGDALSDVWMPHEEWARLVEQADEEMLDAAAETGAKKRAAKSDAEVIRILEAGHEETRKLLAKALGAGVDSSWGELFEVARGYVMALDAERERFVQRVGEVLDASRAADNAPTALRCPRCLGPCLTEPKKCCTRPAWSTRCAELSKLSRDERQRMKIDHPAWFCAESEGCVLQAPHSGDCMVFAELVERYGLGSEVTAGGGDPDCPSCGAGEEQEPEHPECPHCGEADGHAPKDCAMRETEAEEEPKPKAKRSRKKKAQLEGEQPAPGVAERPLRPRKVRIHDEEAQAEVPF